MQQKRERNGVYCDDDNDDDDLKHVSGGIKRHPDSQKNISPLHPSDQTLIHFANTMTWRSINLYSLPKKEKKKESESEKQKRSCYHT